MNSGGYVHHDDLIVIEMSLRYAAQRFLGRLKVCEIGTFCGSTSRSINSLITKDIGVEYEHWCVDKKLEPRGLWEPPFSGAKCVWEDSTDAASKIPDDLSVVIVDGCHCLHHVLFDFALYSPKISNGGLILFHDVNPELDRLWRQYQYHGDMDRRESYMSVRLGLNSLGLMPLTRTDWDVFSIGGNGGTWWGGMASFIKKAK